MLANNDLQNKNPRDRSASSARSNGTNTSSQSSMTSHQHMIAHFTAKAKKPNLSYHCYFSSEHLSPNMKLSSLDACFYSGRIKMEFIAENIITGQQFNLIFSQSLDKDKKNICYALDGKPIIIKPIGERYKTLKGCISGLYSATYEGDVLSSSDDSVLLCSFVAGVDSPCYKADVSNFNFDD